MEKTDKDAYLLRLNRITELFSGMVRQAEAMSRHRCPYRDRNDECTAAFRCRNQRPAAGAEGRLSCGHDGRFDYRSAWESDPEAHRHAKERIERFQADAALRRGAARRREPPE
jgi:hypothetical protein